MEKCQKWVETLLGAQSPFQNQNFGNTDKKLHNSRYESVLPLTGFAWFPYPVSYTLLATPEQHFCDGAHFE